MTLDELRQALALLAPGSSVTIQREQFLEALGVVAPASADVCKPPPSAPADLTVADVAAQLQRTTSTVRGWLTAGLFPGAFKLRGRDWRIPLAALEAFRAHQLQPGKPVASDLGAWRRTRKRGTS